MPFILARPVLFWNLYSQYLIKFHFSSLAACPVTLLCPCFTHTGFLVPLPLLVPCKTFIYSIALDCSVFLLFFSCQLFILLFRICVYVMISKDLHVAKPNGNFSALIMISQQYLLKYIILVLFKHCYLSFPAGIYSLFILPHGPFLLTSFSGSLFATQNLLPGFSQDWVLGPIFFSYYGPFLGDFTKFHFLKYQMRIFIPKYLFYDPKYPQHLAQWLQYGKCFINVWVVKEYLLHFRSLLIFCWLNELTESKLLMVT